MSRCFALLVKLMAAWLAGLVFAAAPASAHELSMAEMQLRETAHGQFMWIWMAGEKMGTGSELKPIWPDGCQAQPDGTLNCGEDGLTGSLGMEGVGKRYSAVLVKIFWRDGQSQVYTLTAGQPTVQLYGAAQDERGMGEVARAYTVLGVEHILSGVDHLCFVIGLLFLVGFERRLLWTITAFTAAHSLTLALSALGWLVLRPPPVEATIALSIVLVAGEALHQRRARVWRWWRFCSAWCMAWALPARSKKSVCQKTTCRWPCSPSTWAWSWASCLPWAWRLRCGGCARAGRAWRGGAPWCFTALARWRRIGLGCA
jgi:hypothetical protein